MTNEGLPSGIRFGCGRGHRNCCRPSNADAEPAVSDCSAGRRISTLTTTPVPLENLESAGAGDFFTAFGGRVSGECRIQPALARAVHRSAVFAVHAFALRTAVGEMADEAILRGPRAIPAGLQAAGFTFAHQSVGEALAAALG